MDLQVELARLLPKAIAWAQLEAERIVSSGQVLKGPGLEWARRVGVTQRELVRIEVADTLPMPSDPELQAAAIETRLLGPNMSGLALGHSILLRRRLGETLRNVVHELRHVHQYEQVGSIAAFFPLYLSQIIQFGYVNAPYELDAKKQAELME